MIEKGAGITGSAQRGGQAPIEATSAVASPEGAGVLRKTFMSIDPIESMCSLVRHSERNIKRPRGSAMLQRQLETVLL